VLQESFTPVEIPMVGSISFLNPVFSWLGQAETGVHVAARTLEIVRPVGPAFFQVLPLRSHRSGEPATGDMGRTKPHLISISSKDFSALRAAMKRGLTMKQFSCLSSMVVVMMISCLMASAQIPRTLSYQGVLTDSLGNPKPDGTYSFTFRLYDAESGGGALWTEAKTLAVRRGLFSTFLGDQVTFGASLTFERQYWLSVQVAGQPELSPRIPLSAAGYSLNSLKADTAGYARHIPSIDAVDSARIAGTVKDNAITTAKIQNGTILFADVAQNGAANGEVMKWNGSAWTAAPDLSGGGTSGGGWTDNGSLVSLSNPTDTVALNTTRRLGKLNINGDIGLNLTSSLYFGSDETRINGLVGGDLRLGAADDLFLVALEDIGLTATRNIDLSAAADISLGPSTSLQWVRFDNSRKRLGIGTLDPVNRLHVASNDLQSVFLEVEGTHPSQWGQAGVVFKTPKNTWQLAMDAYLHYNFPDGALSLHSQNGATQAMTWLEDGRVGIGTVNPARKLHVYGSAQVKDTLYVGTVKATKIVNEPGVAYSQSQAHTVIHTYWTSYDTVALQTPGPGYVYLCFSGALHSDHDFNKLTRPVLALATDTDGTGLLVQTVWEVHPDLPSGWYYTPVALQTVVRASSAGVHSFYVIGLKEGESLDTDIIKLNLGSFSAVFLPVAYGNVDAPPGAVAAGLGIGEPRTSAPTGSGSVESRLNALTQEVQALRNELNARQKQMAPAGQP
jgi:hypothetical protein